MSPNYSYLNLQRGSGVKKLGRRGFKSQSWRWKLRSLKLKKKGTSQTRCHHRFPLLSASFGASLSARCPGRGGGLRGPEQRCVLWPGPLPLSGKVVLTLPRGLSLLLKTKDGLPPRGGVRGRERERESRMEMERGEGTRADEEGAGREEMRRDAPKTKGVRSAAAAELRFSVLGTR